MTEIGSVQPTLGRLVAGGVCLLQSLTLGALTVFYVWELAVGASADPARAVMSALLIAVGAVALALLARGWWRGLRWVSTPTIVWNLLLLPVAWTVLQSGRTVLGVLIGGAALLALVTAARSARAGFDEPD